METKQYTNYAFISYKREDEKWAKWLQHKLEHYKLPAVIRAERSDLPKYIRPVFRDGTDLSGGVLADQLRNELLRSKYLIIICSPNATKSEWVNKEASTFIEEGRLEQIIPFIVEGTPHASNPTEECFPLALQKIPAEKELLGINVQEVGKDMAFIRLVATMLGVRFDTLWQRHRRDLIRRRIAYGCAVTLFCLLGLFIWDYNRATYSFFADHVDCYGIAEGVIPLTREQVAHRNRSFQFEYRRIPFGEPRAYSWRLVKVSYVNSTLHAQDIGNSELKDRYPIQTYEYNKQTGVVARVNFCDTKEKVLLRHVLSERDGITAAVADFIASQEQRGTGFVGANLSSMYMGQMDAEQQKSNIVRFVYERDAHGHIIRQTYHSNNDYQLQRSAVSDGDGIFGRSFTLDSLGRRVKVEYLGLEGERANTQKGVNGRIYEYNKWGGIHKVTYVNEMSNPTLNDELWAICIDSKIDEWGNVTEMAFYGTDGKPCLCKDGFAKCTAKYDDRGNRIECAFFGTDGKPCLCKDGLAKWTAKYDDRGNQIECAFFGTDGKPCLCKDGYAKWTAKYDDRGNQIERAFFGTDGKPCLCKDGFAKCTAKYDDRGNQIECAFFGTDGKPCLCKDGFAKCTAKYDDKGNVIEFAFFGTDGEPCLDKNGIAKWTAKYDDRGNEIEHASFGTDGKPCLCKDGFAKWTVKYDDKGNVIEYAFFGTDGEPCLDKNGIAKWTAKYDDRGNQIERAFFGTDGKPCLCKDGFAKWTAKYDDRGNRIECAFFGTDGEPRLDKNGIAKWTAKYDDRGNQIEHAFFGTDGEPRLDKNGIAKWTAKYDDRGNQIECAFFGTDGEPCLGKNGTAKWTAKYDDRGNQIEYAFFGTDDEPCLHTDGFAKRTIKYDERGNMIGETYYGTAGESILYKDGYAMGTAKYDNRGNIIEAMCFGLDGELCLCSDGFAKRIIKYDAMGNVIEESYFGINGLPCLRNEGFAKGVFKYDYRGNLIEISYWGINNEPCLHQDGNAKVTYKYDDKGNRIESAFWGVDGKPITTKGNFSKMTCVYDDHGNQIERLYFGTDGMPCKNYTGVAIEQMTYNEYNCCIKTIYYDENGNKCVDQNGICQTLYKYNEHLKWVEQSFYGIDGMPCEAKGIHKMISMYDERQNQTSVVYYNKNNQKIYQQVFTMIVRNVFGYAAKINLPINSILLQWNEWKLNDSMEMFNREHEKSLYGKKRMYFLTPDAGIKPISVEKGLAGIITSLYNVEKSQADEWLKKLEQYKKEHPEE